MWDIDWYYLVILFPLLDCIWSLIKLEDPRQLMWILVSFVISIFGYIITEALIPVVADLTEKANLYGYDLGKKGTEREQTKVPEALGIVCGTVFLMCTIGFQLLYARTFAEMCVYNSALFSICFMIFLGFTDDTLNLKWRYKLILPAIASLPLLAAYNGNTALYVPEGMFRDVLWDKSQDTISIIGSWLNHIFVVDVDAKGAIVELGFFFLIYMGLLAIFCTNAINIYAGINGLEVGQAYIIGCNILAFKLYELNTIGSDPICEPRHTIHYPWETYLYRTYDCLTHAPTDMHGNVIVLDQTEKGQTHHHQLFTIFIMIPFLCVTVALLKYNWYPAKVFVGDTYCYFAGMTFAVVGIHGHFSKTLLLLFIPQIINFILSIPQLFKIVPCPRHRLPKVHDARRKLLHCSTFPCKKEHFKWLKLKPNAVECPNFTLINLVLRVVGPMDERSLTVILLIIQQCAAALAYGIRYKIFEIPITL